MNKLKQNGFWIFCGLLAAGLVAAIALVVFPLWTQRDKNRTDVIRMQGSLKTILDKGVPGGSDISEWQQRKKAYQDDYKAISKLYTERDVALEAWFSNAQAAGGQVPLPDQFSDPYKDACKEVEAMLTKAGVAVGTPEKGEGDEVKLHFGFNWQNLAEVEWDKLSMPDRQNVIRALQKRFWIAKHLAQACAPAEGGKLAARVLDLRFFKPLCDDVSAIPPLMGQVGSVKSPEYIASWVRPQMGAMKFPEFELPDRLGTTLSFGFGVEVPFDNVPRFLQHLLNPAQAPHVLLNIAACRIFVASQNETEISENILYDPNKEPGTPGKVGELRMQKEKAVNPVNATLWLTCQVIDFDPALLPKWATQ